MTRESAQTEQAMHRDWEAIGGYISTAMQEVALQLSGEQLAKRIALRLLQMKYYQTLLR